jgi:TolA-binding protein
VKIVNANLEFEMKKISVKLKSVAAGAMLLSGALFFPGVATATGPSQTHDLGHFKGSSNGKTQSNYNWHFDGGVKAFENGEIFKAKRIFRDLIVIYGNRSDPSLNYYMGRIKAIQGDHKGAIQNYKIVLRQFPNTFSIMARVGKSYVMLENKEQAVIIMSKLKAASKMCAGSCKNKNTIDASIAVLEKALAEEV